MIRESETGCPPLPSIRVPPSITKTAASGACPQSSAGVPKMENKQNTTAQHAILLIWKLLPAPYRYQDSNNSHGRVRQEPVSTSGAVCPERFSLSGAPPGGSRSKAFREAGVALENEFQSKLDLPSRR